jgi:hypothetical protein
MEKQRIRTNQRRKKCEDFKKRTDSCFKCNKRFCYTRILTLDGQFDEIACDNHIKDLETLAKKEISLSRQHLKWVIKGKEKVKKGEVLPILKEEIEKATKEIEEKYYPDEEERLYKIRKIQIVCKVCGKIRYMQPTTKKEEARILNGKFRDNWTCLKCKESLKYKTKIDRTRINIIKRDRMREKRRLLKLEKEKLNPKPIVETVVKAKTKKRKKRKKATKTKKKG